MVFHTFMLTLRTGEKFGMRGYKDTEIWGYRDTGIRDTGSSIARTVPVAR
jgi:hypothetical protein